MVSDQVSDRAMVIISDLDGTLLDHETYSPDAAQPALDRIREAGIPLVLCTSKTRAELEPLRRALRHTHPFIVENGGGVFVPIGYFPFVLDNAERRDAFDVLVLGDRYDDLVRALREASDASGVGVRGFAEMSDAEVAHETGLTPSQARAARQRDFDEPFLIHEPHREVALLDAITRGGNRWTRGGRFHHITGRSDKARAVQELLSLYRRWYGTVRSVGLGDAPNDASFLNTVDRPILVRSPRVDDLRALVPRGEVTSLDGPAGWNQAVVSVLDASR